MKYGYGRGCAQISIDIRNGLISRNKALDWVDRYDHRTCMHYMNISIQEILSNIGMTMVEYEEIANEYNMQG